MSWNCVEFITIPGKVVDFIVGFLSDGRLFHELLKIHKVYEEDIAEYFAHRDQASHRIPPPWGSSALLQQEKYYHYVIEKDEFLSLRRYFTCMLRAYNISNTSCSPVFIRPIAVPVRESSIKQACKRFLQREKAREFEESHQCVLDLQEDSKERIAEEVDDQDDVAENDSSDDPETSNNTSTNNTYPRIVSPYRTPPHYFFQYFIEIEDDESNNIRVKKYESPALEGDIRDVIWHIRRISNAPEVDYQSRLKLTVRGINKVIKKFDEYKDDPDKIRKYISISSRRKKMKKVEKVKQNGVPLPFDFRCSSENDGNIWDYFFDFIQLDFARFLKEICMDNGKVCTKDGNVYLKQCQGIKGKERDTPPRVCLDFFLTTRSDTKHCSVTCKRAKEHFCKKRCGESCEKKDNNNDPCFLEKKHLWFKFTPIKTSQDIESQSNKLESSGGPQEENNGPVTLPIDYDDGEGSY